MGKDRQLNINFQEQEELEQPSKQLIHKKGRDNVQNHPYIETA